MMLADQAARLLWHRLLGWPASASGRLCHRARGHGRGDRRRRALVLAILRSSILERAVRSTSIELANMEFSHSFDPKRMCGSFTGATTEAEKPDEL